MFLHRQIMWNAKCTEIDCCTSSSASITSLITVDKSDCLAELAGVLEVADGGEDPASFGDCDLPGMGLGEDTFN